MYKKYIKRPLNKSISLKKTVIATFFSCATFPALAEITLIEQNPEAGDPLSRLNFQVGGSIRPQIINEMGKSDSNRIKGYRRNVYDGGTRFRFSADYYLFDDVSLIGYYELGVNIPRVFNWHNHYAKGANDTDRRMLYGGLKSKTWGTLTYGKQNSVYYSVVGAKTDLWGYDMLGQAPGNGYNGNYDGSYRSYNLLQYKNSFGPADLYVGAVLADKSHPAGALGGPDLRYKRKGGGALGVDYHITDDLILGTAYSYIKQSIRAPKDSDQAGRKENGQQLLGSSLSWKPDNWIFAFGGGWYRNFLVANNKSRKDYFAGNAAGIEYYAGYAFPIKQYFVQKITPYFAGDRLKYNTGRKYQWKHETLGVETKFDYGFALIYEHVFTSSTDTRSDVNFIRLRYDF